MSVTESWTVSYTIYAVLDMLDCALTLDIKWSPIEGYEDGCVNIIFDNNSGRGYFTSAWLRKDYSERALAFHLCCFEERIIENERCQAKLIAVKNFLMYIYYIYLTSAVPPAKSYFWGLKHAIIILSISGTWGENAEENDWAHNFWRSTGFHHKLQCFGSEWTIRYSFILRKWGQPRHSSHPYIFTLRWNKYRFYSYDLYPSNKSNDCALAQ